MINIVKALPEDATFSDIYNREFGQDLVGLGRQGAQGLTLGGSDEAEAIIRSLVGDKSYNENIDQIRSEIESFSEKNPEASTGAYIAGVIPTLAMSVPALATKLGVTASSAGLGALEGFLSGENIEGRAKDAAIVGTLSGLAGYGGEKLLKYVSPKVSSFFRSLSRKSSEQPVDPSRRSAMTKIAAAPLAVGALSEVPVGKIIEDVMPVSDIPAAKPVAKKIAGAIVKNVGQPSKTQTIGELMQMSDFAYDFTHPLSISPVGEVVGRAQPTMASEIQTFSEKLNKAKKYFEMKNKAETADELDMLSPNGRIADHLESLQKEFGYTNDQIINFIDETDSVTRKNATAWEKYLEGGIEGDPDVGKELGLGDESGEGWFEDDFWEKFYGSNEADIAGNTIAKAEE